METLATILIRYDTLLEPARGLFDAYDRFIGLMAEGAISDGESPRDHLEGLDVADLETDPVFARAREIRQAFGKALEEIFLDPRSKLFGISIRYGVSKCDPSDFQLEPWPSPIFG